MNDRTKDLQSIPSWMLTPHEKELARLRAVEKWWMLTPHEKEPAKAQRTSNRQLFVAWSDDGQYVAALLGSSETRELMQERIDREQHEERRTINRLRPVEITVHLAPPDETAGDDQLVSDTIAQNTRLLSALTKVTESWVNGRRVLDGIPASTAQEAREALKLRPTAAMAPHQEDKADLLSMAALVARLGREQSYHVPAELLKRASAVLATLADSVTTRRHRGCGADCGLPAGHLGEHVPPLEPTPEREDGTVYTEHVECSNCHATTSVQSVSPFRVVSVECRHCGHQTLAKQVDMSTVKATTTAEHIRRVMGDERPWEREEPKASHGPLSGGLMECKAVEPAESPSGRDHEKSMVARGETGGALRSHESALSNGLSEKATAESILPDSIRKAQEVYRHGVQPNLHGTRCMCEICQDERSGSGNC